MSKKWEYKLLKPKDLLTEMEKPNPWTEFVIKLIEKEKNKFFKELEKKYLDKDNITSYIKELQDKCNEEKKLVEDILDGKIKLNDLDPLNYNEVGIFILNLSKKIEKIKDK